MSVHPRIEFEQKIERMRQRILLLRRELPDDRAGKPNHAANPALQELQAALDELCNADDELKHQHEQLLAAQHQLDSERLRYRDLFEFAPDGYIISNSDGVITRANQCAGSLLKVRSDLLQDKPLECFIAPQSRAALKSLMHRASLASKVEVAEMEFAPRDGKPFTAAVRVVAERDSTHNPIAFRWMIRDITENKRQEQRLRQLNSELEQRVAERTAELIAASRAKDHFLAALSHELRTPLTPVLAALTDPQLEQTTPEPLQATLAMIRRNVELEARLIDDLLDLTRVASGKLQLCLEALDVHRLIDSVMQICSGDIEARQLELNLQLDAACPFVQGDSSRLQQVLWNLLKNAAKFTPIGGSITIRTANLDSRVRIEVSDSGIGIDPQMLPRIFDAFEQGGQAVTKQYGGLGLGLAISRRLIESHGGTINAFSGGRNQGSTFTIELTAAEPPAADVLPASSAGDRPEPLRILLVEDHRDSALILARLLRQSGYQVEIAGDVASSVALGRLQSFDLLISDLGLPDGTGHELLKRIRNFLPDIRAIAVSGFGMEKDLQLSRKAGFEAHLIKPINAQQLEDMIHQVTREPAS
jgi:PAS domain S-box-containing protein